MKQKLFKKLLKVITLIIICASVATIIFGGQTLKNYFLRTQLDDVSNRADNIINRIIIDKEIIEDNIKNELIDSSVVVFYDMDKKNILRIDGSISDYNHSKISNQQLNKSLESFISIVLSGKSIKGITQLDKIRGDSLIVGEPIKIDGKITGALVCVKFPMNLSQVLLGFYLVLAISMFIALILILAPIYLLVEKIFKPLSDMNEAAMSMAKGNFSIRIDESSDDEIGQVAKSINYLGKRLEENDEQARLLEQTRRDYVANISHELRTPVTAIRAVSEMLNDDIIKNEKDKQKYYKQILRESIRLEILIKDMLELSRLQSGSISLEKSKVSLELILRDIIDEFNVIADDLDVNFIIPFNIDDLPIVYTNKDRIVQLLVILLDNAFKFTPSEGHVYLEVVSRDSYVEISVTDTGVGIAKEDIHFVFERFYKADKSHSSKGTGIGLSIAYEIVKLLEEEISVESKLGEGSKFVFTIHFC